MTNQLDEYAFTVHLDAAYEDALETMVARAKLSLVAAALAD